MLASPACIRRSGCEEIQSKMGSVTRKTSCSSNESADVFQIGLDAHSPRQSDCQSDSASSTEVHGPSLLPSAGAAKEEQDSVFPFSRGLVTPPTFLHFFCAAFWKKAWSIVARMQGDAAFNSVHGSSTDNIKAMDLILESFLSPVELDRAHHLAASPSRVQQNAEPEIVLITCGDDFFGRFLLLEILQRIAGRCGPCPL